jgi:hypothetical protein
MDMLLERLLLELVAIAAQVAIWRLVQWFRDAMASPGRSGSVPVPT